jgi:hypothetical protein
VKVGEQFGALDGDPQAGYEIVDNLHLAETKTAELHLRKRVAPEAFCPSA